MTGLDRWLESAAESLRKYPPEPPPLNFAAADRYPDIDRAARVNPAILPIQHPAEIGRSLNEHRTLVEQYRVLGRVAAAVLAHMEVYEDGEPDAATELRNRLREILGSIQWTEDHLLELSGP